MMDSYTMDRMICPLFYDGPIQLKISEYKEGCVFPLVAGSMLPHAEFGPIDHWEDAPHYTYKIWSVAYMAGSRRRRLD